MSWMDSRATSRDFVVDGFADGLTLDLAVQYTEWADQCFYLPRESSAEYGRYRSSRTPFVREILDELSPSSPAQVVVCVKPTQTAGTTIALIFLCGMIDMYPGPALMFLPTDSMARSFSKKKLAPTIRAVPALREKVREPKSRGSGNTILAKEFPGGSLMLTGSNSGASYRSESIKYLVLDDFDGFEVDIEGEGSPEELADRRTGTFPGRKIYINSTTTEKDTSNIERAFEHSSQGYFSVPCPHCGGLQYLRWGGKDADFGIKFTRDEGGQVVEAWYQCEHCGERIDEHHKTSMMEAGTYVHQYPDRPVRGFRYNALTSPVGWVNSWRYIAQKYVEAVHDLREGSDQKYKTWLNSFMSEPYEEAGERPEWADLKARAEPYQPLNVPEGVEILSVGTDVQHNRLAVSVWGWGPGEECWLVYHIEIAGDPLHDDVWEQHDSLALGTFRRTDGAEMHALSVGVDASDGVTTQAVRAYCRKRVPRVFALKGASTKGKPVVSVPTRQDLNWRGERIPGGVEMWSIGTDTAKATLYGRFRVADPGPGRIHTYIGLDDEFYRQLTAEKLVTRFVKGYPVREWHNVRGNRRNEALDCFVYAYAAAIRAGLPYLALRGKKPRRAPEGKEAQAQRERRPGGKWMGGYKRPSWLNR